MTSPNLAWHLSHVRVFQHLWCHLTFAWSLTLMRRTAYVHCSVWSEALIKDPRDRAVMWSGWVYWETTESHKFNKFRAHKDEAQKCVSSLLLSAQKNKRAHVLKNKFISCHLLMIISDVCQSKYFIPIPKSFFSHILVLHHNFLCAELMAYFNLRNRWAFSNDLLSY